MKSFRILYGVVMFTCLAMGLINGIRAYYIILLAMAFLLVFGALMNGWTILSFAYLQTLSANRVSKGEVVKLHLGIYNDKPYPFTAMQVNVGALRKKDEHTLKVDLMPGGNTQSEIPIEACYRGAYQVGITTVRACDMMGLTAIRFPMHKLPYYKPLKLLVLPRIVPLQTGARTLGDVKDLARSAKMSPQGENFAGVRQYVRGDSAKRIHWKTSLRKGELFTKQYDLPDDKGVLLLLDTVCAAAGEDTLVHADTACEAACALAYHSLQSSHSVLYFDGHAQKGIAAHGVQDFSSLHTHLGEVPFGESDRFFRQALEAAAKNIQNVDTVYIVCHEVTPALSQALVQFRVQARVCLVTIGDESVRVKAVTGCDKICHLTPGQEIAKELEAIV